jgi:hypothetical protein
MDGSTLRRVRMMPVFDKRPASSTGLENGE